MQKRRSSARGTRHCGRSSEFFVVPGHRSSGWHIYASRQGYTRQVTDDTEMSSIFAHRLLKGYSTQQAVKDYEKWAQRGEMQTSK